MPLLASVLLMHCGYRCQRQGELCCYLVQGMLEQLYKHDRALHAADRAQRAADREQHAARRPQRAADRAQHAADRAQLAVNRAQCALLNLHNFTTFTCNSTDVQYKDGSSWRQQLTCIGACASAMLAAVHETRSL